MAWIIPAERRHGYMQLCWNMLRGKWPEIEPQTTILNSKFFVARDDVSERIRAFALRRLADERRLQSGQDARLVAKLALRLHQVVNLPSSLVHRVR